jgi:hypothetical protein
MRKLLSRYLVLVTLFVCLGFVSAADVRVMADPPCPENCHTNCKSQFDACVAACPDDGPCVTKCKSKFDACWAYCNWVCGPA